MKFPCFITAITCILCFSACRKTDQPLLIPVIKPKTASDYYPLKKGNYWIYEQFEMDSNGISKPLNITDSVYVLSDTVIGNQTFVKVCDQDNYDRNIYDSIRYYRFDNDKIFDRMGRLLLSINDYKSILDFQAPVFGSDTFYTATFRMADKGESIAVKGGTFITINYERTTKNYQGNNCQLLDLFPVIDKRYAYGVGPVYEDRYGYCGEITLRRRELVRYHIEKPIP